MEGEPKNRVNHRENLSLADKTRYKGTWYEGGVGKPRTFIDPVTRAYMETILAQNRGRDRQGRSLFRK